MWFNEYKKRVTNDGENRLTPLMGLFGGMSAGCFSTLGNNPFDVVKASFLKNLFVFKKAANYFHGEYLRRCAIKNTRSDFQNPSIFYIMMCFLFNF